MQNIEFPELDAKDQMLAAQLRATLRTSESLSPQELARLAQVRADIYSLSNPTTQQAAHSRHWTWLMVPALTVAAVSLGLHLQKNVLTLSGLKPEVAVNHISITPFELASEQLDPTFYQDLEFYQWMESSTP